MVCCFFLKMLKLKGVVYFLIGIYDDDPEIITLDRGEFGKL